MIGQIAAGEDPAAKLAEARAAITVAELAERYLSDEVMPKRKPKTALLYGHYINSFIKPELGKIKAEALTRGMVSKVHLKIGKTRQVTANRVLDSISGMFAFAEKQGILPPTSPIPRRILINLTKPHAIAI